MKRENTCKLISSDICIWGLSRLNSSLHLAGSFFDNGIVQFIAVIQAILFAGKQLQQLQIEEEGSENNLRGKTVCSELLRKLILTASSSSIIGNAAKLLSTLNKEAADQRDLPNLINISDGQFPEVCTMCFTL